MPTPAVPTVPAVCAVAETSGEVKPATQAVRDQLRHDNSRLHEQISKCHVAAQHREDFIKNLIAENSKLRELLGFYLAQAIAEVAPPF